MRQPQEFEYKVEPVANPSRTEAVLNALAEEGWRLVSVVPTADRGPCLYLERKFVHDYTID